VVVVIMRWIGSKYDTPAVDGGFFQGTTNDLAFGLLPRATDLRFMHTILPGGSAAPAVPPGPRLLLKPSDELAVAAAGFRLGSEGRRHELVAHAGRRGAG
jgi:hypothetical protein